MAVVVTTLRLTEELCQREELALELLSRGRSRAEICAEMKVGRKTLTGYLSHGVKKLQARSVEHAIRLYIQRQFPVSQLEGVITPKELEVLNLLKQGCPNKELGRYLKISEQTAKNHVSSIYQKMGIENSGLGNRILAVIIAYRLGLIELNDIDYEAIRKEVRERTLN